MGSHAFLPRAGLRQQPSLISWNYSHASSMHSLFVGIRGLDNFLNPPLTAFLLNFNPPDLRLPSSKNYSHHAQSHKENLKEQSRERNSLNIMNFISGEAQRDKQK
jgi:hypothetical protein